MLNKISSFLKIPIFKNKKVLKTIFIVLLAVCIVLIFASSFTFESNKNKVTKVDNKNISAMEYCEVVENRLVNVLAGIKGIGNVDVFVMVDASPTIKYLEESQTEYYEKLDSGKPIVKSIKTEIVMSKNGSVSTPVVVVEFLPKITGVLIVASGAKDIKFKANLINVVSSVLSVEVSKVEVMEGK